MAESSWVDVADFPIAEFRSKALYQRLRRRPRKQMACEMAVDIAKRLGARTARKASSDGGLPGGMQNGLRYRPGILFAKPMEMHKFARTMLRRHPASSG